MYKLYNVKRWGSMAPHLVLEELGLPYQNIWMTPQQVRVLMMLSEGLLNKQIAFDLGISQITVKLHRSSVMRKMEATSIGELIQGWNMLPSALRADPS